MDLAIISRRICSGGVIVTILTFVMQPPPPNRTWAAVCTLRAALHSRVCRRVRFWGVVPRGVLRIVAAKIVVFLRTAIFGGGR